MTTTTTTKNRQIVIQLPEGMPVLKFEMFQKVYWTDRNGNSDAGHIIGWEFVDRNTALILDLDPGWHYSISRIYGMTDAVEIMELEAEYVWKVESSLS